ncbi:hypothetical protein CAC42_2909 [Sphaceloma murrayae]|uniref:PNPLA domain-containing protein n=1 Tax=Sphaceloma murrayae TaxID=2082308 RepID=A0A2K1R035_9PEZI|nr:hypothetical protein CAC42_2909 [Sphaceloma murrayae]
MAGRPSRLRASPGHSPHGSEGSSPAPSVGRSPARGDVTGHDWKQARIWMTEVKDPWDPCILTLDGGGIRGFSSALILKELMDEVYTFEKKLEEEEPTGELPSSVDELLPCHYFDFMYGTSTGGLIAVMLARLRMTISECLHQYRKVGDELFGHRKNIIPFMTKYRSEPLERAVKALVATRGLGQMHPWDAEFRRDSMQDATGESTHDSTRESMHDSPRASQAKGLFLPHFTSEPERIPKLTDSVLTQSSTGFSMGRRWDPNAPRVCQSCCLTAIHSGQVSQAHLLRSYPHIYTKDLPAWITPYNSGADPLYIWQVTRATSAAPFYFDMLEAMVEQEWRGHKDGGIRENNPSGAALSEFASLYPNKSQPALMLSIGTGRTQTNSDGFMSTLPWPFGHIALLRKMAENISVIPHLVVKYTESEAKHQEMVRFAKGENTWYKRLNVSSGLENMPLDDWKKGDYQGETVPGGASLTRMEDATVHYLAREVDEDIEKFVSPRMMIQHTAEKLVRVRRARRRLGGERWTAFLGHGLREQMLRQTMSEEQAMSGAQQ